MAQSLPQVWIAVVTTIGTNMKVFNKSTIGEGHIKDQKPCQDYSLSYQAEDSSLSVIIVSDGHGGKSYFRSHIGSEKVCHVTLDAVKAFVECADASSFAISGKEYVQIHPLTAKEHPGKFDFQEEQLRQLSKTIIRNWTQEVAKDAEENPVSEWEKEHAEEYLALLKDPHKLYKAYGCTLMAFVVTPTYWFAIHLGDGKCFAFYDRATGKVWDEPLPWDERCFLNKTTSLCQNDAYESFRFAYGGLQTLPLAVFMGSDGLDDTFADNDLLCDFYIKVLKEILFTSQAEVVDELEKSLPVLSKRGSLDDMSVACLYDEQKLLDNISYILEHQISLVSSRIDSSARRVKELVTRKQDLENYLEVKDKFAIFNKRKKELEAKLGISSNTNIDIEMGFADKDIVREEEHIAQLTRKQESLVGERAKIDAITVEVGVEPTVEPITEIEVADVVSEEGVVQPDGESIELPPATEVGTIVETDGVKGLTHKEPHYINEIPATQEEK